jgi:hypothetical protein
MSFDLHWQNGRHNKHSNWTMWATSMLFANSLGLWSIETLEAELLNLSLRKTETQDAMETKTGPTADSELEQKIKKVMKDMTIVITVHPLGVEDGDDVTIEAYAAKVELRNYAGSKTISFNELPKEIQNHFGPTIERNSRFAIESTKLTNRLLKVLEKAKLPVADDLFSRLLNNDGSTIHPNEALFMLSLIEGMPDGSELQSIADTLQSINVDFAGFMGDMAFTARTGIPFIVS